MEQQVKITIYHTSDLHDTRQGAAYARDLPRDENTLLLDAGDAIGGSNTTFRFREPIIDLMNGAHYDAMAMGNREFNYLRWVLHRRADQADFPILCANLVDVRGGSQGCFTPWTILEAAGIKIAVIGLTPVMYPDDSFWYPLMGFSFRDPVESVQKYLPEMRAGADLVLVLSHLGVDLDRDMAARVPGLDLIIGGHSHTLLETPERADNCYIFNGGSHGKVIGRIRFIPKKSPKGSVTVDKLEYDLIRVTNIKPGEEPK